MSEFMGRQQEGKKLMLSLTLLKVNCYNAKLVEIFLIATQLFDISITCSNKIQILMKWLSTERGEKIDMIGVKPELWNLKLFV